MKFPLQPEIGIAAAHGIRRAYSSEDGQIRGIDVPLQVERQPVIQFIVGGILFEIWILFLKSVKFVKKLEVPFSRLGDRRIIRVER